MIIVSDSIIFGSKYSPRDSQYRLASIQVLDLNMQNPQKM